MKTKRVSSRSCLSIELLEDRCCPSGYSITDLGGLPPSPGLAAQSGVYRMNDAGDIAGYSYTTGPDRPNASHPVVWHADATGNYHIIDLAGANSLTSDG